MKIVITNTKGGVGKTTTAIYLATALSKTHTVEVLDADPKAQQQNGLSVQKRTTSPSPSTCKLLTLLNSNA